MVWRWALVLLPSKWRQDTQLHPYKWARYSEREAWLTESQTYYRRHRKLCKHEVVIEPWILVTEAKQRASFKKKVSEAVIMKKQLFEYKDKCSLGRFTFKLYFWCQCREWSCHKIELPLVVPEILMALNWPALQEQLASSQGRQTSAHIFWWPCISLIKNS